MQLILASSSRFRRALLERLKLPFSVESPGLDESRLDGETPQAMVRRLSQAKAACIAERHPDALVIGSDQAAVLDGMTLGKPGHHAQAVAQLSACSGREVTFYTGLCLLRGNLSPVYLDTTRVIFRTLAGDEIDRYLGTEQPYQSAGSFKAEGLGISLFESIHSDDPTALVGLPLIALCRLLRQAGFTLP
ncbi:MAG TPA: Maf family nucleotide pyrophosphatase [Gammaproteobacteria bacterium]|nr:Maf family nucleotide pyrophosphatase [Gammaproteobacteria bacterium]